MAAREANGAGWQRRGGELPRPPPLVHMMLGSKASWVQPEIGQYDQRFGEFPDESLEEWHRARGLWID